MEITLATFNIRNITDRYAERRPLLEAGFAAMAPGIAALQEVVVTSPREGLSRQDAMLAAAVPGRHYRSLVAESPRHRGFGNVLLVGVGEVMEHATLPLGHGRIAQRALIALPGGHTGWVANTHLHHRPKEPGIRAAQAGAICAWMDAAPSATFAVVMGDFNAPPFEPAYAIMSGHGFRSAYAVANGAEPPITWPSGIQAETMDTDGDPNCLDYTWVRGAVQVVSARLAANEHPPEDPTIFPSDHFAIVTVIAF